MGKGGEENILFVSTRIYFKWKKINFTQVEFVQPVTIIIK